MKRSLLSTNTSGSFVKRLDARVKLITLFCMSLLVVLIDSAVSLGALFLFSMMLHVVAKTESGKLKALAILLAIALWGTIFSQAIFYAGFPRTAVLTLIPADCGATGRMTGGILIYREGFLYGVVQGLRFLVMTTLGMLVVWTTEPQDMLAGMLRMRVPYAQAFMLITAFRFIPILLEEVNAILLAMRIKGFRALKYGIIHPVRTAVYIMNPLLANLVRKSGFLALSVECRGFSPSASRSTTKPRALNAGETLATAFIALSMLGVVSLKVMYLLYYHGLFYSSALRPLYSLARNYL